MSIDIVESWFARLLSKVANHDPTLSVSTALPANSLQE